ncbi:hypothetical protein ES708_13982 [subsurface metagenome]
MRNKPKWYSILLLGLILLLAIPLASCAESYTKDDLNDSYQQGYDDGYSAGYEVGYDTGYSDGIDDALAQCKEALENGYDIGYQDAKDEIPTDYWLPTIYDAGHDVSDFFIEVISLTSPINPGEYATIEVQTLPNELLTTEVWYMSGRSEAEGLSAKRANDEGYVSWTWKVGTNTTAGSWPIIIASLNFNWWFQGYENITESVYIEVR